MKSQEQRIKDATAAFLDYTQDWYRGNFDSNKVSQHHWQAVIAHALEAADREPPKWPTDESVSAYLDDMPPLTSDQDRRVRDGLRAAMLADPIIKAAIAYRDAPEYPETGETSDALLRAVNEAGL